MRIDAFWLQLLLCIAYVLLPFCILGNPDLSYIYLIMSAWPCAIMYVYALCMVIFTPCCMYESYQWGGVERLRSDWFNGEMR